MAAFIFYSKTDFGTKSKDVSLKTPTANQKRTKNKQAPKNKAQKTKGAKLANSNLRGAFHLLPTKDGGMWIFCVQFAVCNTFHNLFLPLPDSKTHQI